MKTRKQQELADSEVEHLKVADRVQRALMRKLKGQKKRKK
jgi:hypothetical protein